MCKISTPPPGLLLLGPWQAPINWLLFLIVLLVLLRWFTQTFPSQMHQPTSPSLRPAQWLLLIATYALLLGSAFLVFIVATPSLQVLNYWFQSQLALLSQTCEPGTDQYIALNLLTAQASHAETYLGLLSSGGLIVALICMRLYTRSVGTRSEGNGQQSSSEDRTWLWISILALVLLIATNVVYALSPVLGEEAGCDESCGFEMFFIRLLGSVLGIPALLLTLLALTRGLIGLWRSGQWDRFVGLLLLLVVSVAFFLHILLGPGRLARPDPTLPDLSSFLNCPSTALVFTVLTFLPVALLLSTLSRSTQNRV